MRWMLNPDKATSRSLFLLEKSWMKDSLDSRILSMLPSLNEAVSNFKHSILVIWLNESRLNDASGMESSSQVMLDRDERKLVLKRTPHLNVLSRYEGVEIWHVGHWTILKDVWFQFSLLAIMRCSISDDSQEDRRVRLSNFAPSISITKRDSWKYSIGSWSWCETLEFAPVNFNCLNFLQWNSNICLITWLVPRSHVSLLLRMFLSKMRMFLETNAFALECWKHFVDDGGNEEWLGKTSFFSDADAWCQPSQTNRDFSILWSSGSWLREIVTAYLKMGSSVILRIKLFQQVKSIRYFQSDQVVWTVLTCILGGTVSSFSSK